MGVLSKISLHEMSKSSEQNSLITVVEAVPENQEDNRGEDQGGDIEDDASSKGDVEKKKQKKKFRYYENYITKLLKTITPRNEITLNARQQLNSLLVNLSRIIVHRALELAEISKKKTISMKEIISVVRMIMPYHLGDYCVEVATKAVETYNESKVSASSLSKQARAGILFPPSISEKFLRKFGTITIMVAQQAPVALAAILEYIASEILEDSSLICNSESRVRITVRDMELSVRRDKDYSELFTKNGLEFLGGGILPFVHDAIKYDKKGEQTDISKTIDNFQKAGDCLMFARHPFEQLIRSTLKSIKPDMKISNDVFLLIQYYVEQWLINLLQKANSVAIYTGRVKLVPNDIEVVRSILDNRIPEFFIKNSRDI